MKEELITFETAKISNEKGFNYMKANCYGDNMAYNSNGELIISGNALNYILAPTQSLLQKWLREIHNIYVSVTPVVYSGDEKASYFYPIINNCTIDTKLRYDNYEQALEIGILKALELIK